MYNAFWRLALFVRGQSFSVKPFDRSRNGCQVIRLGGGKRFSWAFRAGTPSPLACLILARPFFLVPTTSKRHYSQAPLFSSSPTATQPGGRGYCHIWAA